MTKYKLIQTDTSRKKKPKEIRLLKNVETDKIKRHCQTFKFFNKMSASPEICMPIYGHK